MDHDPTPAALPAVGFLGVGEIAAAMVDGLCAGPGAVDRVHLSPRGADTAAALARYLRSAFAGVGRGLADGTGSLADLVTAHETPGGLNAQLRRAWFDEHARASLHDALDAVLARLTR